MFVESRMIRKRFAICVAAAGTVVAVFLGSRGYGQTETSRYDIQTEVVRDLNTHLTWQRMIPAGTFSFDAATRLCADLALGGHDDWRVPSMQEFQSIVDENRSLPAIDVVAFPDTPNGFWSGTRWAGTPLLAWHVDFDTGSAAYDTGTTNYHVRCVRWEP